MSAQDRIIGTAVLADAPDGYQWLHYLRVGTNIDRVGWDSVPVLPDGSPQPEAKLPSHFPENRPWRYTVEGETLRVRPSINMGSDWWHNAGEWTVKFVRATGTVENHHRRQLAEVNSAEDTVRLREALT
jgi:hypothetical protein